MTWAYIILAVSFRQVEGRVDHKMQSYRSVNHFRGFAISRSGLYRYYLRYFRHSSISADQPLLHGATALDY